MRTRLVTLLTAALVSTAVVLAPAPASAATPPDHVLYWNNVLLRGFRAVGGAPTGLTRAGAMMNAAIYDTVNSITPMGAPYLASYPGGGDVESNIDAAAYRVLTAVFPTVDFLPDLLTAGGSPVAGALTGVTGPLGLDAVTATPVGDAAANGILTARADDGSDTATTYVADYTPGHWRPTSSGPALSPQWGHVRPFAMTSRTQFRPPDPGGFDNSAALLPTAAYAAQVNDVKSLGRATSRTRTADQTQLAYFWANDLDGTYKPPGQLYTFTEVVSRQRHLTQARNARLFALVGIGLADAAIVAWDRKYDSNLNLWRPETAIREANSARNPAVVQDPAWVPLSVDNDGMHFTPPFPSYTSGHSTLAGSWSAVMAGYFGTDRVSFIGGTEDSHAVGVTRAFRSFSQAGFEDALSRVYLGVHYRWDCTEGFASGQRLGGYVVTNFLRPAA